MKDKARKPTTTPGSEPPSAEVLELPERWSVQRKTELVLRLLRGEALDAVSPESQVPVHELPRRARGCPSARSRGLRWKRTVGRPPSVALTASGRICSASTFTGRQLMGGFLVLAGIWFVNRRSEG